MKPFRFLNLILIFISIQTIYSKSSNDWTLPLQKCWTYNSENMTNVNIASDNANTLFLYNSENEIEAIDTNEALRMWTFDTVGQINSNLFFFNDNLYFTNRITPQEFSESGKNDFSQILTKLDASKGTTVLRKETTNKDFTSIQQFEKHLLTLTKNGMLKLLNSDLESIWNFDLNTDLTSINEQNFDGISLGSANKTLINYDPLHNKILGQYNLKSYPTSIKQLDNGVIYIGDHEGNIYYLDRVKKNKLLRMTKTGGEITSIDVSENIILISSNDNFVYGLSRDKEKTVWKKRMSGRLVGRTIIADRFIVYLTINSDSFEIINVFTGQTVNRIFVEKEIYFVSSPIVIDNKIIIPTNKGLYAYSPKC